MKKGCELLRQCEDMISKLGLFSANETKEDISSTNLKYFLVSKFVLQSVSKCGKFCYFEKVKF